MTAEFKYPTHESILEIFEKTDINDSEIRASLDELRLAITVGESSINILSRTNNIIDQIGNNHDKTGDRNNNYDKTKAAETILSSYALLEIITPYVEPVGQDIGNQESTVRELTFKNEGKRSTNEEERLKETQAKIAVGKAFVNTVGQLQNDIAGFCEEFADTTTPENAIKLRSLTIAFIDAQQELGSASGNELISLRAIGNRLKADLNNANRLAINKNIREAITILQDGIKRTDMSQVTSWGRSVARELSFDPPKDQLPIHSIAVKGRVKQPEDANEAYLKRVVNVINHYASTLILLADLTSDIDPIDASRKAQEARELLEGTGSNYLRFLESRVKKDDYMKRALAIKSNLAYTLLLELYADTNMNGISFDKMTQFRNDINNYFITGFLQELQTDKCSSDNKKFFKLEALTRAALVVGTIVTTKTNSSSTEVFNPEENIQATILNGVLSYLRYNGYLKDEPVVESTKKQEEKKDKPQMDPALEKYLAENGRPDKREIPKLIKDIITWTLGEYEIRKTEGRVDAEDDWAIASAVFELGKRNILQ